MIYAIILFVLYCKGANVLMKKSDKPKKHTARKVLCIILCVVVAIGSVGTLATVITYSINKSRVADSFKAVEYTDRLEPVMDENGYYSFTSSRDFRVMQLTDVHLGGGWMSFKKDLKALNAVAAMITAEKPDLVVVTGDIAYPVPFQAGTFNNMSGAKLFASLMEKLGVYWTVTFGNHDSEAYSYYSRAEIAELYESEEYSHCLFSKGPDDVDGCGNYVINVRAPSGIISKSLFFIDSHSYTDKDYFGINWRYDNIHDNQIEWYKQTVEAMNKENSALAKEKAYTFNTAVSSLAFFHIPLMEYRDAWNEYLANGRKDTENVKLYYGDVGEKEPYVYCGVRPDGMFEAMLECGTDGVFCGHDHLNDFSLDYKGIRLTYSKSVDYLAYAGIQHQGDQRGCTMISIAQDGSFEFESNSYYQEKYEPVFEKEAVTFKAA